MFKDHKVLKVFKVDLESQEQILQYKDLKVLRVGMDHRVKLVLVKMVSKDLKVYKDLLEIPVAKDRRVLQAVKVD